jgi:hypothetical protein
MNASAQLLYGNQSEFRDIVLDACKRAVAEYRGNNKEFAKTPCGMYISGFMTSYLATFYTFFSEQAKVPKEIMKRMPFCFDKEPQFHELAELWIDRLEKATDFGDVQFSLLLALKNRYPCSDEEIHKRWN